MGLLVIKLMFMPYTWLMRHQRRKALGELAECSLHLPEDIGVSEPEAGRDAAQWFWQA